MDKEVQQINEFHKKAHDAKKIACKKDDDSGLFKIASDFNKDAASLIDVVLKKYESTNVNFLNRTKATKEYYLFERYECLYAYEYREKNFEAAIEAANQASIHINQALEIINQNYDFVDDKVKRFFDEEKGNWILSSLTIRVKQIEPVATKAIKLKDYVTALDTFREMNILYDKIYEYIVNAEIDPIYKRTEMGNYYANKAGVANSISAVYVDKTKYGEYYKEIMEQLLDVLKYLQLAQNVNPEQDKFKKGLKTISKSVKALLGETKQKWFEYLIEFKDDKNLKLIMRKIDNDFYARQNAKLEIEKDKPKRFILTFGLLFSLFIGLGYFLLQIASAEISWFRFIALLLCLPLFFIVIGAFALRTTESLKEENFMKLMELALMTNLKGLRGLADKKET